MFTAQERLAALQAILGSDYKTTNSETHYNWGCIHCVNEGGDTKGDNFHFDLPTNKYSCFANNDHTRHISFAIREYYKGTKRKKQKKEPLDILPITEAPQEIADYFEDRLIKIKALELLKIGFDKTYGLIVIPTGLYRRKIKDLNTGKTWWEEEFLGTKKFTKEDQERLSTEYPVEKYGNQKNIIILEGIPDIWAAKSLFSKDFLGTYHVVGTVNGCAFIPLAWQEASFWQPFDNIYIVPDQDQHNAGQNAAKKLADLITRITKNQKAHIINLPFKHKRMVYGEELEYRSKDYNDWVIEGGTEQNFLTLLQESSKKQEEEKKILEIEVVKYLSGDVIRNNFLPLTNKRGLVGEEPLKVASYLCGNSRLTNEINAALHCRVVGDSGMGKSKVMEFVGENFIGKDFIERASFTVASIYRRDKDYFKQKVLFQSEILPPGESQEEINALFRTLKTKGRAERDVTTKKGNDIVSITLTVEGPTSQWGTTTRSDGRDEDLNRDVIVNPDNSRDQTYRIQKSKMQRKKKYNPGIKKALKDNLQIQNQVQEFLKEHIPECVEIPYSEYIKLPIKGGAARRDPDKITRLIESCCQTNILNRAFKLLDCADKIDELVGLMNDFRSNPLHQILNDELSSNSNEFEGTNDLMKSTSEMLEERYQLYLNLQEIALNSKEYFKTEKVIIKKQDDDILIFTSDPKINYIVLKEFVKKNDIQFVLISDPRDFEIVKEYCAEALEAPYQKLTRTYQAAYRKLLEALPDLPRNKAGGEVGYNCTTAEVEGILECTNHWAWDVLKKLVNEGYCTVDEKKKPYIYNFTKTKLAESFNKEGTEHFYKLELKPFPAFQNLTSSDVYNAELNANSNENKEIASDEVLASEVMQMQQNDNEEIPEEMRYLFTAKLGEMEEEEESLHQLPDFLKSDGKKAYYRDCPF